jgi:hypothetical protein
MRSCLVIYGGDDDDALMVGGLLVLIDAEMEMDPWFVFSR